MTDLHVTLLGTGSPIPDPSRAGPATLVSAPGLAVLIDCGRGVCLRLVAAAAPPATLDALLLTHLHSDHITDLNDVLTTRWVTSPAPMAALPIYGPPGTRRVVDAVLEMLGLDEGYRRAHHDDLRDGPGLEVLVTEVRPGDSFRIGDASVSVHATDHRPVAPTVGFRIEHGGEVVAIAGDTVPCTGLDELCAGADVYVQTVIRDDLVRALAEMLPALRGRLLDVTDYHSTVEQAGQTAARAGVRKLVLTHYVPALQPGAEDEWRALAAAHFAGEIVLGPDLTRVAAT